jgi:hypothetical protein
MRCSHERLIRKLLSYRNHPAVVEFIFYAWPGSNTAGCVAACFRGNMRRCMFVCAGEKEESVICKCSVSAAAHALAHRALCPPAAGAHSLRGSIMGTTSWPLWLSTITCPCCPCVP